MLVSVEAGEGLQRQIKVRLPAEAIEQEIDKRLQGFARTARVPGFRPGKVPLKVLRQRYGDGVRGEVLADQVQRSFPAAADEAALRPAGVPEIVPDIDPAAGRYEYVARFEVLPEVELASLAGQQVRRPQAAVTDEDLAGMIEHLRGQQRDFVPISRPAQSGDRVRVSFQGSVDGESFPGSSAEDLLLDLGSGRMIPGFEAQLEGAVAGESRTVAVTFPDAYHEASLAGRPALFAVEVREVLTPELPAVDADFVARFGQADGDVERFRADVRANMERELRERVKARVKQQVMDMLYQANPITLPNALVAQEIQVLQNQARRMAGGGAFQLPDDLFVESARRRVALGLILAEIVKRHNLRVTRERVMAAVNEVAATYEDPQSVVNYYLSDQQRLASVESLVLEELVVEQVLSEVELIDEPVNFSDLTESGAARSGATED